MSDENTVAEKDTINGEVLENIPVTLSIEVSGFGSHKHL